MLYLKRYLALLLCLLSLLLSACGAPPPGIAPVSSSTALPTITSLPTTEPTTEPTPEPTPTSAALAYLWPRSLPAGMEVVADQSTADEDRFELALRDPANAQSQVFISGGAVVREPPAVASRPIQVRGTAGLAASTGAGFAVWWQEGGQPYVVSGFLLSADAAVAIAETLDPLTLETWRAQLSAAQPGATAAPSATVEPSATAEVVRCPVSGDLKGDVDVAFDPFCVVWVDRLVDELGFRIDVSYGGGEQFSYQASPDETQFVMPPEDAPRRDESPEMCQRRGSFTLSVTALLPAGEQRVGGMGLDSECMMGFPPATPEPTAVPTTGAVEVDSGLAALRNELATRIASWEGLHAVSVTDLQTGQRVGVNGDRAQLAACTIKLGIMVAVAQDIEAGRYTESDVADLVQSAMGPSNTWPARELLRIVGGDDIGAGVHRVNAILRELGARGSILTHPPGYPDEEYGYLESVGIAENHLTADDLTVMLEQLYRGAALSASGTEYVLQSMTIAPDWMDQPLRSALPADARVYHKIGQLYEPENVWNDAGIVVFERGGQRYAFAFAYLGSYGASWQAAYAHETELAAAVWAYFDAAYPG